MLCDSCESTRFPYITAQCPVLTDQQKSKPCEPASNVQRSHIMETRTADTSRSLPVVSSSSTAKDIAKVKRVICNELLAYICFYRDNSNATALRRVVISCFSAEDVSEAKKLMMQEFESIADARPFFTKRHNSTSRSACEAEIDDIISLFDAVDTQQQTLDKYLFVASDFNQLPKFGPEELNVSAVVDRQVRMEQIIQNISASMDELTVGGSGRQGDAALSQQCTQQAVNDIQRQLDGFNSAMNQRLDHLSAICCQLAETTRAGNTSSPSRLQHRVDAKDRSKNIIVFGVAEDRSAVVWRQTVDAALRHVTGSDIDVVDMYRIGRFVDSKVRPIVVTLRSAWDRRIILSNCRKLKDFEGRVFIVPDEEPDVRRQKVFDRIKKRAEREGKLVVVANGVLSVDGVNVYSLKDGRIA